MGKRFISHLTSPTHLSFHVYVRSPDSFILSPGLNSICSELYHPTYISCTYSEFQRDNGLTTKQQLSSFQYYSTAAIYTFKNQNAQELWTLSSAATIGQNKSRVLLCFLFYATIVLNFRTSTLRYMVPEHTKKTIWTDHLGW